MPAKQASLVCSLIAGLFLSWVTPLAFGSDDQVKDELKRHQGTWVTTSSIFDGQAAAPELVRSIKRIVTDDHVVWERDGKRFAGTTIVLDPKKEPKTIDVIPDGGPNRGEHILGIYKLEGDTITICMAGPAQPRPKDFKAEKGSGCTLRTFEREKGKLSHGSGTEIGPPHFKRKPLNGVSERGTWRDLSQLSTLTAILRNSTGSLWPARPK